LAKEHSAYVIQMSNHTGDGIADVKSKACDILLDYKLAQKASDPKRAESILNRLHVGIPKPRDNKERPPIIPDTFQFGVKKPRDKPTVKEL